MKKYLHADGLFWVFLGIGICIGSVKMKLGDFHTPGAGFLPFFSGAFLAVFGLLLFSSTLFCPAARVTPRPAQNLKDGWGRFLRPLLTVGILLGYIVVLEPLGFLLTTFVCLLLLFKLSETRKWGAPLLLSAATAVLSYLLFSVWLQCQLPKGVLRFW